MHNGMSQKSHHELRAIRRHTYAKADRLKVPAGCTGAAKRSLKIVKKWVSGRVQWGAAIAKLWARENGLRIVDDMMQIPSERGSKPPTHSRLTAKIRWASSGSCACRASRARCSTRI